MLFPVTASQEAWEELRPDQEISDEFETWSLFLVCHQRWLLSESNDEMGALHNQFLAFGEAIGPDHLAVWFLQDPEPIHSESNIPDVQRNIEYCLKFNLPLSDGPYVVVTSNYPDNLDVESPDSSFLIVHLNGADSVEISNLLTELNQKIRTEELATFAPDGSGFWVLLVDIFVSSRDTLLSLGEGVKVTFKTPFFSAEVG